MNIYINDSSLVAIIIICIMIITCSITFSIWHYNIKAVEFFTANNYEEVSDKGTSTIYWRKAKLK